MFNRLPKYRIPLKSSGEPAVDVKYWNDAYHDFENGNYQGAVVNVINYINANLLKGKEQSDKIEISHSQGSAKINLTIDNRHLKIHAPFLRINNETNKVALMRKVSEINFYPLTLVQIISKNDILWFQFNCPVDLCQPNKIYDAIREICVYADDYDDEFIDKYNAQFYEEPEIKSLSANEKKEVWEHFQEIKSECEQALAYFEQKRWAGSEWDMVTSSMLNLANIPCMEGIMRSDLEEHIYLMYNGQVDFNERLKKGKNFLKNMFKETTEESLFNSVYHAEKFISLRLRSSVQIIQKELKAQQARIWEYVEKDNHFISAYLLQGTFLKLLYDFNVEQDQKEVIQQALLDSGGQDVGTASKILSDLFLEIVNGDPDQNQSKSSFEAVEETTSSNVENLREDDAQTNTEDQPKNKVEKQKEEKKKVKKASSNESEETSLPSSKKKKKADKTKVKKSAGDEGQEVSANSSKKKKKKGKKKPQTVGSIDKEIIEKSKELIAKQFKEDGIPKGEIIEIDGRKFRYIAIMIEEL
ncbi:MAG: hypothetical protein MRY83_11080 [Flavobacteriales bacterium]|nr:hypothetical protein [Flavobacteriales bacterium]